MWGKIYYVYNVFGMTRRDILYNTLAVPAGYIFKPIILLFFPKKFLIKLGQFLSENDKLLPSDLVAVLGGGSIYRVRFGVDLYKHGFAKKIVIYRNIKVEYQGRIKKKYTIVEAKKLGVDTRDLIHDNLSENTFDEAEKLKKIAIRANSKSIIVITDGYHLRRARIIFNKQFAGLDIRILFHSSGEETFDPNTWWKDNIQVSNLISEYFSIGYVYLTKVIQSLGNEKRIGG